MPEHSSLERLRGDQGKENVPPTRARTGKTPSKAALVDKPQLDGNPLTQRKRRLQSLLSVSKLGGPARAPRTDAARLAEEDGGSPKSEQDRGKVHDEDDDTQGSVTNMVSALSVSGVGNSPRVGARPAAKGSLIRLLDDSGEPSSSNDSVRSRSAESARSQSSMGLLMSLREARTSRTARHPHSPSGHSQSASVRRPALALSSAISVLDSPSSPHRHLPSSNSSVCSLGGGNLTGNLLSRLTTSNSPPTVSAAITPLPQTHLSAQTPSLSGSHGRARSHSSPKAALPFSTSPPTSVSTVVTTTSTTATNSSLPPLSDVTPEVLPPTPKATSTPAAPIPGLQVTPAAPIPAAAVPSRSFSSAASAPSSSIPSSISVPPTSAANVSSKSLRREKDEVHIVNGRAYYVLELIGQGGSSKVYRVLSKEKKVFALKRISIGGEANHVANYHNEIALLQRMKGRPYVIQLIEAQEDLVAGVIYMVFELGTMDLAHFLQINQASKTWDNNSIRYYWKQILECTQMCHDEKIIHLDLKPPNFVLVDGCLKLIDFGIAKEVAADATSILNENNIGTLDYMSPESVVEHTPNSRERGHKLGRSSDVWSLGCILYQMVYGSPPLRKYSMVQKMRALMDPNFAIPFGPCADSALLQVMKSCLQYNPKDRPTIAELLVHPYLAPKQDVVTGQHIEAILSQLGILEPAKVAKGILVQIQAGQAVDLSKLMKTTVISQGLDPAADK